MRVPRTPAGFFRRTRAALNDPPEQFFAKFGAGTTKQEGCENRGIEHDPTDHNNAQNRHGSSSKKTPYRQNWFRSANFKSGCHALVTAGEANCRGQARTELAIVGSGVCRCDRQWHRGQGCVVKGPLVKGPVAKSFQKGAASLLGERLAAREPVWDGEGWGCDRVA